MTDYGSRVAACQRLRDLYEAELCGLRTARAVRQPTRSVVYSPDPDLQQRFQLGLEDGQTLLRLEDPPCLT